MINGDIFQSFKGIIETCHVCLIYLGFYKSPSHPIFVFILMEKYVRVVLKKEKEKKNTNN